MSKKMLIDATHAEETRVVVVEGNKVDEFDFETITKRQIAGNIYLAKVTRVEPSLQAAFVDYGGNRHGFLAFSEIHPDYYQIPKEDRERLLEEDARREREAQEAETAADERRANKANEAAESSADASADASGDAVAEGDDAPKPKKRRTRRKKSDEKAGDAVEADKVEAEAVSEDATSEDSPAAEAAPESDAPVEAASVDADAPEADVVAEAAEEEAPKPKRRRAVRKKKTDSAAEAIGLEADDDDVVSEDAPDDTESLLVETPEGDEVAAKKPRARRTRKKPAAKAAEEAATETSEADAGADANEGGEAAAPSDDEKPKRRRSRGGRKKKDEAASDGDNDAQGYESVGAEDVQEEIVRKRAPMRRYKIQEVIRVRQILLVQVVKEERGNKGAALTTYLSLAGRYCVLMPNTARGGGVSRKITNVADRKKLKEIAAEIDVPQGAGLIVRTAGARRTKTEIKRDYEYLLRLWEQIRERTLTSIAPSLIYEEGNLIKRSIRDLYSREIDEVIVDGENGFNEAKEYMKMLLPSHAKNVKQYQDTMPLFSRFQVESYLGGMMNPTVQLRSGGYIVINLTEALVAVDVNSGRATKEGSIEDTAVKTNLEAAEEVARQMRLRDLAGLIVIDFIDMEERRNNNAVEKCLKEALKHDRARVQVGRISGFGLLEMSRQRLRPGMLEATTTQCPHCLGTGYIRSDENLALAIMRELDEEGTRRRARELLVKVPVAIANYLLNDKRSHLAAIEARFEIVVRIEADPSFIGSHYEIERFKTPVHGAVIPPKTDAITVDDSGNLDEPVVAQSQPPATEEDEDGKPKRRRRRRRGGRGRGDRQRAGDAEGGTEDGETDQNAASDKAPSTDETSTDESAVDEPVEAAPADEAPTETAAEAVATEGAVADEKPKRTRRRKKVEPEAEAAAEVPEQAVEAEEKPKPKRRARKPKAEVAAPDPVEAPVEAVFEAPVEAAQVAEPTPAPVEAAPEPVAETKAEADKKSRSKRSGWWSRALGK